MLIPVSTLTFSDICFTNDIDASTAITYDCLRDIFFLPIPRFCSFDFTGDDGWDESAAIWGDCDGDGKGEICSDFSSSSRDEVLEAAVAAGNGDGKVDGSPPSSTSVNNLLKDLLNGWGLLSLRTKYTK